MVDTGYEEGSICEVLDEKLTAVAKLLLHAKVNREVKSRGGCPTNQARSDALFYDLEPLAAKMRMLIASLDITAVCGRACSNHV